MANAKQISYTDFMKKFSQKKPLNCIQPTQTNASTSQSKKTVDTKTAKDLNSIVFSNQPIANFFIKTPQKGLKSDDILEKASKDSKTTNCVLKTTTIDLSSDVDDCNPTNINELEAEHKKDDSTNDKVIETSSKDSTDAKVTSNCVLETTTIDMTSDVDDSNPTNINELEAEHKKDDSTNDKVIETSSKDLTDAKVTSNCVLETTTIDMTSDVDDSNPANVNKLDTELIKDDPTDDCSLNIVDPPDKPLRRSTRLRRSAALAAERLLTETASEADANQNQEKAKSQKSVRKKPSKRVRVVSSSEDSEPVAPIFHVKKKKKLKKKELEEINKKRNFLLQTKAPELIRQASNEYPRETPLPKVSHVGAEGVDVETTCLDLPLRLPSPPIVQENWVEGKFLEAVNSSAGICSCHTIPRSERLQSIALNKSDSARTGELLASKYAPTKLTEVLCHQSSARKLKDWLSSWEWNDDDESDDSDSEYEPEELKKALLIQGDYGCGKMAVIQAVVTNILHWKVIEINLTNCTSGGQLLSTLKEATQSHQVSSSEETNSSQRCVVVFHSVDCWRNNQGILSAIRSFIRSSKRPVLLTTNSHIDFKEYADTVHFESPSTDDIKSWISAVAACENISCICSLQRMTNKTSLSSSFATLQFWGSSGPPTTEKVFDANAELLCELDSIDGSSINSSKLGHHFGWEEYQCLRDGVLDEKPLYYQPPPSDLLSFMSSIVPQSYFNPQPDFLTNVDGSTSHGFMWQVLPFVRRLCFYENERKRAGRSKRRFYHYLNLLEADDIQWLNEQCLPGHLDICEAVFDDHVDMDVSETLDGLVSIISDDDY